MKHTHTNSDSESDTIFASPNEIEELEYHESLFPVDYLDSYYTKVSIFNAKVSELAHVDINLYTIAIMELLEEGKRHQTELLGERFRLEHELSKFYIEVHGIQIEAENDFKINKQVIMWSKKVQVSRSDIFIMYQMLNQFKTAIREKMDFNFELEKKLNRNIKYNNLIPESEDNNNDSTPN